MLNKLFEKLSGKKVYGISALGAIAALATLFGHPLPIGPLLTDQEAWTLLYTTGLVAAGRSTIGNLIKKIG